MSENEREIEREEKELAHRSTQRKKKMDSAPTPLTSSDGSRTRPESPEKHQLFPRNETVASVKPSSDEGPTKPASKEAICPSPDKALAGESVGQLASIQPELPRSPKQEEYRPAEPLNEASPEPADEEQYDAANVTSPVGDDFSISDLGYAGALLMDERAAGAERLGKAFIPREPRRRRRGSTEDLDMAGMSRPAASRVEGINDGKVDPRQSAAMAVLVVVFAALAFLLRALMQSPTPETTGSKPGPAGNGCDEGFCARDENPFTGLDVRDPDPCQDFRSYICSWWRPQNHFPELALSAQGDLVANWINGLSSMLEKAARDDRSGVAIKPLSFYQSCINRTDRTQVDAEAFTAFLRRLGLTWPEMPPSGTSALGSIIELNYKLASPIWLEMRVVSDKAAGGKLRRIVLKPCCLDSLIFFVLHNRQATNLRRYYDYWASHYEALMGTKRLSRNPEQIDKLAMEEADIVGKLANLSYSTPTLPLVLKLSEIGRYTKKLSPENWLTQINEHIAGGRQPLFAPQDEVVVSDASVLQCLDHLFENYSQEQLVDHLSWQFVQLHAWNVDSSLLELRSPNYLRIYEPMLCAREVEDVYRPLLATLYLQQHLSHQDRLELTANLSDLRDTAAKMYASSTWLDKASKGVAIDKLRTMGVNFWPPESFFDPDKLRGAYAGFPDKNSSVTSWVQLWISSQEVLRSLVGTSIHEATANMRSLMHHRLLGYDYLRNQVDVAVSALSRPLYCSQGAPGLFYGSLAFSFALDMMKMQDLTGLRVHGNGELVQEGRWSWLSDGAAATYKEKVKCLGAEPVSLSEIAALEVAYKALSRMFRNTSSLLEMSRDIDEQKAFFMALCLHSCAVKETYTPTINCNALLRHSRQFSEVFHCKTGSRMNPFHKCAYF